MLSEQPITPRAEAVTRCDLCGVSDAEHLMTVRDRVHGLPGEFGLVRCSGCHLVRLSPRPEEAQLGFYYPAHSYTPYADVSTASARGRVTAACRDALRDSALHALGYRSGERRNAFARGLGVVTDRFAVLQRFGAYRSAGFPRWVPNGRALEVGTGNGAFLAALQRHGWHVNGLDVSPDAASIAYKYWTIPVDIGELGSDPYIRELFDYIHMRHVIEHVTHPLAAMTRVRELLKPGGRAYIETPNIASWGFQQYGPRWYPLEAPRHLWLFSPETLSTLATRAGLEVTQVRTSTYLTPRWAAAFREQDRVGAAAAPAPFVPDIERWRVACETVVNHVQHALKPMRGDILGIWVCRSHE